MKLILSIGKQDDKEQAGIISLWDKEDSLPDNEHHILLELTEYQERLLTFSGKAPKNVIR